MKLKGICLIAAAVLSIGTASLAKDKGTLTKFPNWGVITVPNDIYTVSYTHLTLPTTPYV